MEELRRDFPLRLFRSRLRFRLFRRPDDDDEEEEDDESPSLSPSPSLSLSSSFRRRFFFFRLSFFSFDRLFFPDLTFASLDPASTASIAAASSRA